MGTTECEGCDRKVEQLWRNRDSQGRSGAGLCDHCTVEAIIGNRMATLTNALTVAAERFHEHQGEFQKVAEYIEAGGNQPLFAPGEHGVLAAKRLQEQFHRQEDDTRALARWLNGEDDDDE